MFPSRYKDGADRQKETEAATLAHTAFEEQLKASAAPEQGMAGQAGSLTPSSTAQEKL